MTSTTWPLTSVRVGNFKLSTTRAVHRMRRYLSEGIPSPFLSVVCCIAGTLWLYFCQYPFPLSVHYLYFPEIYTLFLFWLDYALNCFFLDKLFSPKINLILLHAVHISNPLSPFILSWPCLMLSLHLISMLPWLQSYHNKPGHTSFHYRKKVGEEEEKPMRRKWSSVYFVWDQLWFYAKCAERTSHRE